MSEKPLGGRAYGHIPHLPGSRMGPGDHHCHLGQAQICTVKARDRHDHIIVQEKLDGSCVAVALLNGSVIPLTRAGYHARTSLFKQHHLFADWVYRNIDRFYLVLTEGERLCGEWLAQAHGTRYNLPHEPFVAFDIITGTTRHPFGRFIEAVQHGNFVTPAVLHSGGPFSIEKMLELLEPSKHGAIDPVEGAMWRVERHDAVDFLAKYVRPDKKDGLYLGESEGREPVWNWLPDK